MNILQINGIISPEGQMLPGEGNYTSAKMVQDFLISNEDPEITVELNTPGGSVDEGFVIYDLLTSSGKDVTIKAYQANSIGTVLLLAGNQRLVSKNFRGLVHNAWLDPAYLLGDQLNSQRLGQLKEEADKNDARIVALYTSVLGKEKETELIALMSAETTMDAERALALGFATGTIEAKETEATKSLAYSNLFINLIKEEMDTKELIAKFEATLDKFANLLSPKAKNMSLELADGKKVYIDTTDGEVVGKKVFMMEGDQITETPAPDGAHKLKDGREVVVSGGAVTEVKEAAPAETVDTLKAQIEQMKAESAAKVQAAEAEKDKAVNLAEAVKAEAQNLKTEFDAFKNQIAGGKEEPLPSAAFQNKKREELTEAEKMTLRVLNKY